MARKLSAKQEAYKNNRIKGMGCSAAYRAAYDNYTMNDNAVSKEATKLEQDPRISPAIVQGRKKATERALITVEDVVRGLMIEAQTNGEGSTQSARVAAWKALSDFTGGFDANTKKVNHSGAIDLSGKSDEELEKLLSGD